MVEPRGFEMRGRPSLVISNAEAFVVVVLLRSIIVSGVLIAPSWTDNRGNVSAPSKVMATRLPSSIVLMEMSAYTKRMSMKALVDWSPRSGTKKRMLLPTATSRTLTLDCVWTLFGAIFEGISYLKALEVPTRKVSLLVDSVFQFHPTVGRCELRTCPHRLDS